MFGVVGELFFVVVVGFGNCLFYGVGYVVGIEYDFVVDIVGCVVDGLDE